MVLGHGPWTTPGRPTATVSMNDVTRILSAIEQGDPQAAEQLLPLVYDELRKLAAQRLAAGEARPDAPGHGPGPRGVPPARRTPTRPGTGTAAATSSPPRPRRCAASSSTTPAASGAAEARRRLRHGWTSTRLDDRRPAAAEDLLALDEALDRLAAGDAEAAELVKLRYFAGLTDRRGRRGPRHLAGEPPTGSGLTPGPGCSAPRRWRPTGD